jgi:hypothetical protein
MNKKQYGLLLALMVFASFVGGAMSSRIFASQAASAEKAAPIPNVIKAERFELLDSEGNQRAVLGMTNQGSQLAMFAPDAGLLVRLEALEDSSHLVFHSRLTRGTALAPVFLGVGDRGGEETGFLQLCAHEIVSSSRNFYFLLEPRKDVKGIRFNEKGEQGILSFDVSEKRLDMRLLDKDRNPTWQSEQESNK